MNEPTGGSDSDLALWMLERMKDSDEFLGTLRAARIAGKRDLLDEPRYVDRHKGKLKKLYQSDDEETVDTPTSLAGAIDEIAARDLLSSREELIEKAILAYIDAHPKGAEGLPAGWQTTFDAARAEIEGRASGAFQPGFVASLAAAARLELTRQADRERDTGRERG
jgi:hypothetical protein